MAKSNSNKPGDFKLMFIMGGAFTAIAVGVWQLSGQIFYLYNFSIIGISLVLGMGLWPILQKKHKHLARRLSQILVGGYLFFGLGMGLIYVAGGMIQPENMQIEGFWIFLLSGIFAGSVLHYFIAKIVGPFIFNRGWCGWACWTVAVLDLLPWRKTPGRMSGKWEYVRYIHFIIASLAVLTLALFFGHNASTTMGVVKLRAIDTQWSVYASMWRIPELWWFLLGNLFYYTVGIVLAWQLEDNRAFCKYLCPITTFLKVGSKFSLTKIGVKEGTCTFCGNCEKNCPMDIRLMEYIREGRRITSSECIICQTCTSVCPTGTLSVTMGFDICRQEHIRRRSGGV